MSKGGGASTADILFPETDVWMMEIRYSPNSGANIAGPSEEALAIKERILGLAKVGVGRIELSGIRLEVQHPMTDGSNDSLSLPGMVRP